MTLEDRFWSKVVKTETCWEWTGYKLYNGYSGITVNSKYKTTAHRVSYEIHKGEIPKDKEIDHLCRNRGCVNPEHLRAVSHFENMQGCDKTNIGLYNKVKTHCKNGHEFTPENIWVYGNGRYCKKCHHNRYIKYKNR